MIWSPVIDFLHAEEQVGLLWRESLIDGGQSTTHANKKSPEESSGLEKSVILHDVPEASFTREAIAGSGLAAG